MADISEKIIEGCKKRDGRSQQELYRLLAPVMYGVCLKYAGNTDDAKDIMQDGFIKVFQNIDQFAGRGSFEGWVRRILINTALEKYRSHKEIYSIDEKMNVIEDKGYTDVLNNLSVEELLKLVQQLSPQYRMVFNLYVIEGYNHKEISEMMGISEGTSKSNLSRARVILQNKIKLSNKLPGDLWKNDEF